MRDPLHNLPIRIKLPLTFVVLGALTFGCGGWLVTGFARRELEAHIRARVEVASEACASSLDGALRLVTSRAEDFASDGLIRRAVEEGTAERYVALAEHLRRNKLPLVDYFEDCCVFDANGNLAANARSEPAAAILRTSSEASSVNVMVGAIEVTAPPNTAAFFPVAVPIRRLDGSARTGTLVAWVSLDRLLKDTVGGPAPLRDLWNVPATLTISDGRGTNLAAELADQDLRLERQVDSRRADGPEEIASRRGLRASSWSAVVSVGSDAALAPLRGFESRWFAVGIVLALALLIGLSVVVRFLVVPLSHVRDMAQRMADGDYDCRVDAEGHDEIGDLGRAFNTMAEAVGKRNRSLIDAHRRLENVVDAMRDGLVLIDARGDIILSNDAARPLTDLLRSEDAKAVSRECPVGPHHRNCAACMADGRSGCSECIVMIGERTFEVVESCLFGGDGRRSDRVLVARDVTERLALQDLEAHQERLAVLGEVTAVVAHELNNPLAAVSMFNQMMADQLPLESPHRENVEVIARNIRAMKQAVRDLLDNACGPASACEIDVAESARDVVRFLAPLAKKSAVELTCTVAVDDAIAIVDEVRLRQALTNLVVNAIHSASQRPPGRVAVEVKAVPVGEERQLALEVIDDGVGVPEELRERIFEPFFTTKADRRGTGLGLPTARRTARAHGGDLVLLPSGPPGAAFRLTVPLAHDIDRAKLRLLESAS